MIELLIDALVAVTQLADRSITAATDALLRANSPQPVVGVPPAGAACAAASAGPGGHPTPTSQLLAQSASHLTWIYGPPDEAPAVVSVLQHELRDRAIALAARGE